MTSFIDTLVESFTIDKAWEGSYPDVVEPFKRPPYRIYFPDGRQSPFYHLGWIIPHKEWKTYIDPYPGQGLHSSSDVYRKWCELGYQEKLPGWTRPNVGCPFGQGFTVIVVATNRIAHLERLQGENDLVLNQQLVQELVDAAAAALGLHEALRPHVKWFQFQSLMRMRSALWPPLKIYRDKLRLIASTPPAPLQNTSPPRDSSGTDNSD